MTGEDRQGWAMRPGRLVLALCCLAPLPGGCKDAHEERKAGQGEPVRPVLVETVTLRRQQVFGPFAGTVEPRYTTNQGFRTAGRMIVRDVNVGDLVKKGQRLALLDETLLNFAVVQSKANVADAQAQLKTAEAADARKQVLARTQAVPQSDVDQSSADRKTAAAKLEQAEAALAKAQENLGYAALDSEFDGVVMAWNAEVGQDVIEGAGVVTLARPDVLEAVVDIPDDLIAKVREKDAFTVALQAAGGVTAKGVVREVAPRSDSATRTRRVRFTLQAPSQAFRIGSTVTVSFATPIPPRAEIPAAALLKRDGAADVWVVPKDRQAVALRRVEILGQGHGRAEVTGLGDGDRVVRAGINRLSEGQAVRVTTAFSYP